MQNLRNKTLGLVAATFSLWCTASFVTRPAYAANIKVTEAFGSNLPIIKLSGEIRRDDDENFRTIALKYKQALVVLDSDGGSLNVAMEIGRIIKLREFSTVVDKDGSCASACALIWLSGTRRTIDQGGRVGFHASYLDVDGSLIPAGMGNALVGHYMSQLGYNEKAVMFATAAPPDKILWLDAQTENISGIDYDKVSGSVLVSKKDTASSRDEKVVNAEVSKSQNNLAEATQVSRNVMFFVNGLKKLGFQAELDNSVAGSPKIFSGVSGDKFVIFFSGCDNLDCNYAEMMAEWTGVEQLSGSIASQSNVSEENFAATLYQREGKNLIVYHYIVLGSDGVSLQNLIDNMNYFVKDFERIGKLLTSK